MITGSAAAGKSTVGAALVGAAGLLVLDGDLLATGAAAVAGGARDYVGFWHYLLAIAGEVHRNRLVPVITCICLPEQLLPSAGQLSLHLLALVSDADTVRDRIARRAGNNPALDVGFHVGFDQRLRGCTLPAPHSFTLLDTVNRPVADTVGRGRDWVEALTS